MIANLASGCRSRIYRSSTLPTKPQPPVISVGGRAGCSRGAGIGGKVGGIWEGVVLRYVIFELVGEDIDVRPPGILSLEARRREVEDVGVIMGNNFTGWL